MKAVVVIALLMAVSPVATAGRAVLAEKNFRLGKRLMSEGKYAEACAAFEASYRAEQDHKTLANIGDCYAKNRQFASAWQIFVKLEKEATTRDATGKTAPTLVEVARTHAAKLEPRVSMLTIDITSSSRMPGLVVMVGDRRLAPAMWGVPIPLDGGDYPLSVRGPGFEAWTHIVTVGAEADRQSVKVPALTASAPVTAPAPTGRSGQGGAWGGGIIEDGDDLDTKAPVADEAGVRFGPGLGLFPGGMEMRLNASYPVGRFLVRGSAGVQLGASVYFVEGEAWREIFDHVFVGVGLVGGAVIHGDPDPAMPDAPSGVESVVGASAVPVVYRMGYHDVIEVGVRVLGLADLSFDQTWIRPTLFGSFFF
jgi:hypothetical protein